MAPVAEPQRRAAGPGRPARSDRRRWLAAAAALALMLGVTWMSSHGQLDLPDGPWQGRDKLAHGAVWCLLGALLTLVAARPALRAAAIAIAIAVAFGVSDETHQSWVPGRDASWLDLVADTVGAAIGALVTTWYSARRWPPSSTASAGSIRVSPPTSSSPISPP